MEELVKKIQEQNCITFEIQDEFFKGKDYIYIRDWLENHGLDRHMIIDKKSAGIIIVIRNSTTQKLLLQIRSTEESRVGIFGGGIEDNETPIESAIRELKEELNIDVKPEQLEFLSINNHILTYGNGDKVHYIAHMYVLELSEFPAIKLDFESNGVLYVDRDSIKNYINIYREDVFKIHNYWLKDINKVLEE
jgi:8-oxo-dGTP pyrophosphatase MutT (NUDIX family)